ncbi:MAG: elongation factor P [Bacteriovoracales bacterium]|nr:elongation factor P [Bacteriovoracales bacterium]
MYQTTDFRNGLKIELEGRPFIIIQFQHVNPGKGSAFVRTKLKNLQTGQVLEKTFKAGVDTAGKPNLDEREMEYLYGDREGHHFMDQKTFETVCLSEENVGDRALYLQEGLKVSILYFNERPITIELPNFVNLKVTETDPGLRGDTAQGGSKRAVLETGLAVNVPLFIDKGDILRIDTRKNEYIERVKNE